VTAPTNFSLEGTTWVGPFNDGEARGSGTLTLVFDRSRDYYQRPGDWQVVFADATSNVRGPLLRFIGLEAAKFPPNSVYMWLYSAQATGCYTSLVGTVEGGRMTGTLNTGLGTCDPGETKRSFGVVLGQQ
jgi:hypothetical protein